ncbi:hypothetical protein [Rosistilla oblonga]|uniref:hypothetical protein n=1 Tax=Rosistilla oblonga TaxID=2527990 RepID=UPI003A982E70
MIDRFGVSQPTRERLKDAARNPAFVTWMRQQCATWSEFQNQQQATIDELTQAIENNLLAQKVHWLAAQRPLIMQILAGTRLQIAIWKSLEEKLFSEAGNICTEIDLIRENDSLALTTSNGVDGLRTDAIAVLVAVYFFEERGTAKLIDAKKLSREDRIAHLSALLPAVYGPKPSDNLRARLRYADEAITRVLSEYQPHDSVPEEVSDWRNRMVKTGQITHVVPYAKGAVHTILRKAAVQKGGKQNRAGFSWRLGQACDAIERHLAEDGYDTDRIADYAAKLQQLE